MIMFTTAKLGAPQSTTATRKSMGTIDVVEDIRSAIKEAQMNYPTKENS